MSLSNTAVPKYYAKFRADVLAGNIPVCKEIEMEMNRINALIENRGVYFDNDAVEGWIRFCEQELTLANGGDLILLDSFKLWGEQVFGWFYFIEKSIYEPGVEGKPGRFVRKLIKRRLIKKQFLIVGRGAAKTMYASTIQGYFLSVDRRTTQQLAVAPGMATADEVLSPIRTAITRARGPLFKFLTEGSIMSTSGPKSKRVKLASTKKGIENFLTNSIIQIRPMRIDKLQGRHDRIATVDEWLSGDIREDVIGAIEQGATKNSDYFILATSSEGTVRNAAGDGIKMEINSILKGEYQNPHVSIWYYKLDDIKEVSDPAMWIKANPNLGHTVSYEAYQAEVEKAENVPSQRNDILAKRFGLPMEGFTYFFTYDEIQPHRKREFWRMPCALGVDLSQGDDFCAFTFLFPLPRDEFGVKSISYITSLTLAKTPPAARVKYEEFIEEGSLIVMDATVLDMDSVYDDLEQRISQREYQVECVGYDPYNAKEFIERWGRENGEYGITKVPQGVKTETVPLGELKTLASERLLLFDEAAMTYAMGNCITMEDNNGNRKLLKKRYDQKIDPVSALMDAYVAYKANKQMFD